MTLPVAESEAPAPARRSRRAFRGALLWALAGAACTGVVWALAVVLGSAALGVTWLAAVGPSEVGGAALFYAALGAGSGLVAGVAAAIVRHRGGPEAFALAGFSTLLGALAGASIVLAIAATNGRVDPLLSSSLALAGVGFLAGLTGRFFAAEPGAEAVRWMLAGAACAAGLWLLGLGLGWLLLDARPSDVDAFRTESAFWKFGAVLVVAVAGAGSGLLVGAFVVQIKSRRVASGVLATAALGALFGAAGGGLVIPVMLWCAPCLHPAASSSLLWAVLGALAGLIGYCYRSATTASATEGVEEEEDAVPRTRIEWLLREVRRRVLNRSTRRVLPVLVVSARGCYELSAARRASRWSISMTAATQCHPASASAVRS